LLRQVPSGSRCGAESANPKQQGRHENDRERGGQHRFTNVFRASDRVSQYLIGAVIPSAWSDDDLLFRILLFIFNRIPTWERLRSVRSMRMTRVFSRSSTSTPRRQLRFATTADI
jgi:hypothetical protein